VRGTSEMGAELEERPLRLLLLLCVSCVLLLEERLGLLLPLFAHPLRCEQVAGARIGEGGEGSSRGGGGRRSGRGRGRRRVQIIGGGRNQMQGHTEADRIESQTDAESMRVSESHMRTLSLIYLIPAFSLFLSSVVSGECLCLTPPTAPATLPWGS
jgi:hypothetical protein